MRNSSYAWHAMSADGKGMHKVRERAEKGSPYAFRSLAVAGPRAVLPFTLNMPRPEWQDGA